MVILRSVFLIPQIIYNALLGNNPGFNLFYILGYVGIRTMIPLYNYTCPANRFLISPNMTLAVTIVSILIFEVMVIVYRFCFCCCNINLVRDFLSPSYACQSSLNIDKRSLKLKIIKTVTVRYVYRIYFHVI
jgi:hypothetical protein